MNYCLKLLDKWKQQNTFHTSLLTPYKENNVQGPNYTQPPADLIDGQEEWKVEHIIRHRKIRTQKGTWRTEFQVQWKCYEDLTWEQHLDHAQDLISDYWNRQSKQIAVITTKRVPHKGKMIPAFVPSTPAK